MFGGEERSQLEPRMTSVKYLVCHDLPNLVRYGRHAPRRYQPVEVELAAIERATTHPMRTILAERSGAIVGGEWDSEEHCRDVADSAIVQTCIRRWRDGLSWEEAGAYDHFMRLIEDRRAPVDGCQTLDDVVRRHDRLDAMYEQVAAEGRLRRQTELPGVRVRERGGVGIHVGRGCEPIWGFDGSHRMAIAMVLDLESIPAALGVVHASVQRSWKAAFVEV